MTAAITAKEQQYARFCEKAGLKQNLNMLYVKGYKRDFAYIKQNSVEYPAVSGKIVPVKTRHGHKSNPRNGTPNSIIEHLDPNGMVDVRTHYDSNGEKDWELHTSDHGNPKMHPFGEHGEHVHEYSWNDDGRLRSKQERDLTTLEKEANEDIL